MSKDPRNPDVGDLIIDASNLSPVIIDLPPGGRIGLRAGQPGCREALAEIRSNQAQYGVTAGIRDEDVEAMEEGMTRIDEIDRILPAARKMVELIEETRAVLDDSVQRRIAMIASLVENRAKMMRTDELIARYARTREYRSSAALKGVRTRLRNQADNELGDEPAELDVEIPAELSGEIPVERLDRLAGDAGQEQ